MVLLWLWVRHLAYPVNGITLFSLEYGVWNDIVLFYASGSQTFFLPCTTWKFHACPAYQQNLLLKNSRIYLHYYYRFTLWQGNIW